MENNNWLLREAMMGMQGMGQTIAGQQGQTAKQVGEIEMWMTSTENHLDKLESLKTTLCERYSSVTLATPTVDSEKEEIEAITPVGKRLANIVTRIKELSRGMGYLIDGCQL